MEKIKNKEDIDKYPVFITVFKHSNPQIEVKSDKCKDICSDIVTSDINEINTSILHDDAIYGISSSDMELLIKAYQDNKPKPTVKTWDNLEYGDSIIHKDKTLYIYQGRVGDVLFMNNPKSGSTHGMITYWNNNSTIQQSTPIPSTKELTIEEIAKKFNMDVKDVRIKDK